MRAEHHKRGDRSKPSTEALLRAASMGQQVAGQPAASRVPRTSSMQQAKQGSEASKKLVFSTLQSPNVEGAEKTEDQPKEDNMKSRTRVEHNTAQRSEIQKHDTVGAKIPANAVTSNHGELTKSTDSTRQSREIPKSVAALANRFEAKAGSAATRGAQKQPPPPRPNPTSTHNDSGAGQPSALPKAPTSVVCTIPCEGDTTQAVQQGKPTFDEHLSEASTEPAASSVTHRLPQDPRLQWKGAVSAGKLQRPSALHVAKAGAPSPADGRPAPVQHRRIPTPAGLHSAVPGDSPPTAKAVPLHAAAFGSPMPGHVDVADASSEVKPARNSMLSMSCNVNMASPTSAETEVASTWKRSAARVPAETGGNGGTECAQRVAVATHVASRRPGHETKVQPRLVKQASPAKAPEKPGKKSAAGQAPAASPPTRAAFSRLSDACTSPVESLWVRCLVHGIIQPLPMSVHAACLPCDESSHRDACRGL